MGQGGIELARDALARGDSLVAYDAASSVLAIDPQHYEARYLAALSLVRSGADERATSEIEQLMTVIDEDGLSPELREDIEALGARVAKDRAFHCDGLDHVQSVIEAARLYERVADRYGRYFACVNAATLWFLSGDNRRARALAVRSIELARQSDQTYWALATQAEAALVIGEVDTAITELAQAVQIGGNYPAARATTHRQLKRICDAMGRGYEVLEAIQLPLVLHYCGNIFASPGIAQSNWEELVSVEVDHFLDDNSVGIAYGALAAGADIIIAEKVLERGAELHVVLPFSILEFEQTSVSIASSGWPARFRRCLDQSSSCTVTCDSAYLEDTAVFGFASRVAMGHAINRARYLGVEAMQLAVSDGRTWSSASGTSKDIDVWRRADGITHVIDVQTHTSRAQAPSPTRTGESDCRAIIFADFHGFSRLRDEHYEPFISGVLGAMAQTIDAFGSDVLYRNSWGDAIQLVISNVVSAANCALEIQRTLTSLDLGSLGLPSDLRLRVAGHVGRLVTSRDPIRGVSGYWGREMTRAAQIEPRTPEGEVYVTDAFAALVALEPESCLACEYVGRVMTAKNFETIPMYRLRRDNGCSNR
jgi:adenylate cyclase